MDQFVVTNIDELLLPSKQIGLSCYGIFAAGYTKNALSSARFTVDVEDIPAYGCYRMLYNSDGIVNGPKFPNLKSIGDYGLA